ncbi:MAG: ArnT family glycosyltransferase [Planctomycetota bacterium]|jgi:hypothetical protein
MSRRGILILLILVVIIFFTRFPLRARTLFDWDSVQFALSAEDFDIVGHKPHPPGYIFLVLSLKAGTAVLGDPNLAFIVLNILASAGTLILLFFLARSLWSEKTAWIACWSYIFCTVFWFHGSVATAYAVDGFWSLAIGLAAWRAIRRPSTGAVFLLAAVYAVGAGFRQNLTAVFFPLFAFAVWKGTRANLYRLAALTVAAVIIAAWFVPTVLVSGGLTAYRQASGALYSNLALKTSLYGLDTWESFFRNILALISGVARSLNILCVPLGLGAIIYIAKNQKQKDRQRFTFFIIYLLPPSLVFCAVHLPKLGYLLAVLPVFFAMAAGELIRIADWLRLRAEGFQPGRFIATSLILFAAFNIYLYCFQPSFHGMSREATKIAGFASSNRFSLSGISKRDARNNGISALGKKFPAETSMFICAYEATRFLRHASFYLPRHGVVEFNVSTGDYMALGDFFNDTRTGAAKSDFGRYEYANLQAFAEQTAIGNRLEKNYAVVPGDKSIEIVSQFHVFRIPVPQTVNRIILLTTIRRLKRSAYLQRSGEWSIKYLPLPCAEELETCALVFTRGVVDEFSGG